MLLVHARGQAPFREISDGAVLELYTLQALDGRLLTGAYSRFGWHHPGPLYLYALAPFYALSGRHTAGMQVGALVVNAGAVALTLYAISAASPAVTLATALAVALFAIRSNDMLVSVWNPHVVVLPLVSFLVTASAFAATGRATFAVWLVVLGSLLVQTHLAMAPVVGVVGLLVILRQRRRFGPLSATGLLALLAVLWLPPLVEQFTHRPGNLTKIVAFFTIGASGQPASAAVAAWSAMLVAPFASEFAVASGRDFSAAVSWPLAVAAVELALLVAAGVFDRRRDSTAGWLAALCAVATLASLAAAFRIRDQIVDHEIFWMSALGVLNVAALTGLALVRCRARIVRDAAVWVNAAVLGAVMVVGVRALDRTVHRARTLDDHAVDVLFEQFDDAVRAAGLDRPLVHIEPSIWPVAAGALLQVRKNGGVFAVDDKWTPMFGDAFVPNGREDAEFTFGGSSARATVIRNR